MTRFLRDAHNNVTDRQRGLRLPVGSRIGARPEASACTGWEKRIDAAGRLCSGAHRIHTQRRQRCERGRLLIRWEHRFSVYRSFFAFDVMLLCLKRAV